MDISFCDRCDGSIPRGDLESGAAEKKRGRLVCPRCLQAESTRGRTVVLFGVAALLLAASLGALAAWLVLGPRIDAQRAETDALRTDVHAVRGQTAAGVQKRADLDAALQQVIGALPQLRDALEKESRDSADSTRKLAARLETLVREISLLKVFLKRVAASASGSPEPGDVETWLSLLASENAELRHSALVALAGEDDERVSRAVLEALGDPEAEIRALAAEMAGERALDAALPKLVALLGDRSDHVRDAAGSSLDSISGLDFGFDATASEEARKSAVDRASKWLEERVGDE